MRASPTNNESMAQVTVYWTTRRHSLVSCSLSAICAVLILTSTENSARPYDAEGGSPGRRVYRWQKRFKELSITDRPIRALKSRSPKFSAALQSPLLSCLCLQCRIRPTMHGTADADDDLSLPKGKSLHFLHDPHCPLFLDHSRP